MSAVADTLSELDQLIVSIDEDDEVAPLVDAVCARIVALGPTASPDERPALLTALDRLELAAQRHQQRVDAQLGNLRSARRASVGYAPIRPKTTSQRLNVKV